MAPGRSHFFCLPGRLALILYIFAIITIIPYVVFATRSWMEHNFVVYSVAVAFWLNCVTIFWVTLKYGKDPQEIREMGVSVEIMGYVFVVITILLITHVNLLRVYKNPCNEVVFLEAITRNKVYILACCVIIGVLGLTRALLWLAGNDVEKRITTVKQDQLIDNNAEKGVTMGELEKSIEEDEEKIEAMVKNQITDEEEKETEEPSMVIRPIHGDEWMKL